MGGCVLKEDMLAEKELVRVIPEIRPIESKPIHLVKPLKVKKPKESTHSLIFGNGVTNGSIEFTNRRENGVSPEWIFDPDIRNYRYIGSQRLRDKHGRFMKDPSF